MHYGKIKLLTVLVAIVLMVTASSWAQIDSINVGVCSGRGPLSEGLNGTVSFKSGSWNILAEFNNSLSQFVFTKKVGDFSVGPSFGQQTNALWVAPIIVYSPWNWLLLTTWNGVFFGRPGSPSATQINFGFGYQAVDIVFGNIGFGYSLLHFMKDKPMNLPYGKYTLKLFSKIHLYGSATYNIRDRKPMFQMGCYCKFKI
jgi:hypothetical protein